MILHQLETLLAQQGAMTLDAISKELGLPTSALQGMLDLLISKGRITTLKGADRCGACTSCPTHQQISYSKVS